VGTGGIVGSGGIVGTTVGTGGSVGTGGTGTGGATGTGGTTQVTLSCASPIAPTNGIIADFSDANTATNTWGPSTGLHGVTFSYPDGSDMVDTVDANGLHLTGTIAANATANTFGGGGLSFYACATVGTSSKVQFNIQGSAAGCTMTVQIRTFDQLPAEQNPSGGCYRDAGGSCFGYPATHVPVPSAPTDVAIPFSSFSGWSTADATQVVGLQWQFARTDPAASCTITNVTITDIKLLP